MLVCDFEFGRDRFVVVNFSETFQYVVVAYKLHRSIRLEFFLAGSLRLSSQNSLGLVNWLLDRIEMRQVHSQFRPPVC